MNDLKMAIKGLLMTLKMMNKFLNYNINLIWKEME